MADVKDKGFPLAEKPAVKSVVARAKTRIHIGKDEHGGPAYIEPGAEFIPEPRDVEPLKAACAIDVIG